MIITYAVLWTRRVLTQRVHGLRGVREPACARVRVRLRVYARFRVDDYEFVQVRLDACIRVFIGKRVSGRAGAKPLLGCLRPGAGQGEVSQGQRQTLVQPLAFFEWNLMSRGTHGNGGTGSQQW